MFLTLSQVLGAVLLLFVAVYGLSWVKRQTVKVRTERLFKRETRRMRRYHEEAARRRRELNAVVSVQQWRER